MVNISLQEEDLMHTWRVLHGLISYIAGPLTPRTLFAFQHRSAIEMVEKNGGEKRRIRRGSRHFQTCQKSICIACNDQFRRMHHMRAEFERQGVPLARESRRGRSSGETSSAMLLTSSSSTSSSTTSSTTTSPQTSRADLSSLSSNRCSSFSPNGNKIGEVSSTTTSTSASASASGGGGRMRSSLWRISRVNHHFELCDSYPEKFLVPASISDDDLRSGAWARYSFLINYANIII